jgi:hypothetical protein
MSLQIEYLPPKQLKAYAGNARVHSPAQLEQIAKSIAQFGFNVPILVRADNTVVAGHGRLEAARRLGLESVPVIRIDHLSEDQVKAFTLADNKIALNSGWDFEKLSAELTALAKASFDLDLTGFSDQELDTLLDDTGFLPEFAAQELFQISERQEIPAPVDEPKEPRATDNEFSNFEMIMRHTNKLALIETLSEIRTENGYLKLEDALMHLHHFYQTRKNR